VVADQTVRAKVASCTFDFRIEPGQGVAKLLTRLVSFAAVFGNLFIGRHGPPLSSLHPSRTLQFVPLPSLAPLHHFSLVGLALVLVITPAITLAATLRSATRPTIVSIASPRRRLTPPPRTKPAAAAIARAVKGSSLT